MTRKLRTLVLFVLLLLLAVFLLQRFSLFPSLGNLFSVRPVQIAQTPLLVKHIKEVSQLMTIELYDEVVVDSTKGQTRVLSPGISLFPVPPLVLPAPATLVLVVKGRVLAGVDLQQLNEKNIFVSKDSIAIRLPAAQILDVIINPSDVETFAERGNWAPDEVTAVKLKAREKMIRDAHEQQILQRANEKARSVVEKLLQSSGFRKISVTTATEGSKVQEFKGSKVQGCRAIRIGLANC